jgi:hypothetical protein
MINSLMSRMGEAQKLSIPQLQQAIQDGTLPPYVGIPLLQDKMKQEQMAKSSQQAPQQPPIAQQVMQEASQHGVEALPSNLPTEEMAGGGIVAFAGGGLDDEEVPDSYQDQLDESEDQEAMQSALENQAYANEGIGSIENRGVGIKPESKGTGIKFESPIPSGGSKGIQDILRSKAEANKLPPELLNAIAGVESGYKSNAANPNSSAKGLFQFTNATWKAMGGKEGEQFDPEKNAELGAKYVRQNAEGLKRALGRDPTYGEVYASHMFGLEGAKGLLKQDPNTPIANVVSTSVLKANPNLQDKNVGQVLSMLNQKTGQGIVALAKGGIVHFNQGGIAHFSAGGTPISSISVDPYADPLGSGIYQTEDTYQDPFAAALKSYGKLAQQKADETNPNSPSYIPPELRTPTEKSKSVPSSVPSTIASEPSTVISSNSTPPVVAPDPYQTLMDKLDARDADAKKQKTIDGYMGLLTAGLGMMGGSSPYAMENIGKGALAGVQQYGESQKLAASEEANRDKNMVSLIRAKQLGDISQATQGRLNTQFQQSQTDKVTQQAQSNFQQALKMRQAALAKDPTFLGKTEAEQNSLLYSDPVVQRYAQAAGFDPSLFGGSSSSNVLKFDSSGKPIK